MRRRLAYTSAGYLCGTTPNGTMVIVEHERAGKNGFRLFWNGCWYSRYPQAALSDDFGIAPNAKLTGDQKGRPAEPVIRAVWRDFVERNNQGDPNVVFSSAFKPRAEKNGRIIYRGEPRGRRRGRASDPSPVCSPNRVGRKDVPTKRCATVALSVRQPWAGRIASGKKTVEFRSRRTHYRGPLLICASKHGSPADGLPRGVTLCLVDLVDCLPEEEWAKSAGKPVPNQPGWCWILANPRPVPQVPVKGQVGLFHVDPPK